MNSWVIDASRLDPVARKDPTIAKKLGRAKDLVILGPDWTHKKTGPRGRRCGVCLGTPADEHRDRVVNIGRWARCGLLLQHL